MKTLAHAACKVELLRRLRRVTPGSRRRWGRMSAHQMLCHLADSFRAGSGRLKVRRADLPLFRTVLRWGALYLPFPWPPGIPTLAEVDPLRKGTQPGVFAADIGELEVELELFVAADGLEGRAHPLFGPMSAAAWLRWGWLHTDHHLRQFGL